ncbi:MAG: hypothetical protein FWF96_05330, partial [Kiritimatiellaeota bacterium]|nr:hypothetical protein [Kiritimatiellota bacterium]
SSQSCATPNVILNAIAAWAVGGLVDEIEKRLEKTKGPVEGVLEKLLAETLRQHQRVLFDGDNYSAEWRAEAARRGLEETSSVPGAIAAFTAEKNVAMLEKLGVFTECELRSRVETYTGIHAQTVRIEAEATRDLLRSHIGPAAARYAAELRAANLPYKSIAEHAQHVTRLAAEIYEAAEHFDAILKTDDICEWQLCMKVARAIVDELEALLPRDRYPFPTYADMFFAL